MARGMPRDGLAQKNRGSDLLFRSFFDFSKNIPKKNAKYPPGDETGPLFGPRFIFSKIIFKSGGFLDGAGAILDPLPASF